MTKPNPITAFLQQAHAQCGGDAERLKAESMTVRDPNTRKLLQNYAEQLLALREAKA